MKRKQYFIWEAAEYLLGLVALFGLFAYVYLHMSTELRDPDIWLHLKTGEYILQNKTVPHQDIFSGPMAQKEWIDHSWLIQVVFYLVFASGGADNLILLSAVTVTLAFVFLFFSAWRHRRSLTACALLFFIAMVASTPRLNIRPENFSILCFAFYLFILSRCACSRTVFLLPLIQVLWVNVHGFFILGPLMLGIFVISEQLKRRGLLPWEWNKIDPLSKDSYRRLLFTFWLAVLATFINPYGYKTALYPLWVGASSTGKSAIFYNYINELLPTWSLFKNFSLYYVLILVSAAVFIIKIKKINFAFFVLWLFCLIFSIRINRNIIFFNFAAFSAIAPLLVKSHKGKNIKSLRKFLGGSKFIFKFLAVLLLIIWTYNTNLKLLKSHYYIFEKGLFKSPLLGISAKRYPEEAAEFLLEKKINGNIFNLFNYGSYLIWRLYPQNPVFIDGRTELYGEEFFKEYKKISRADKEAAEAAIKKYNLTVALISGGVLDTDKIQEYFFQNPQWALVYFDKDSLIFLKDTPENRPLIGQSRIDLNRWHTEKADLEKIGWREVYPEPYAKRAWKLLYLGFNGPAAEEAKEALRVLPSASDGYNVLARIYIKEGDLEKAFQSLRLAKIYDPSDMQTLLGLGEYYMRKGRLNDAVAVYKKLVKDSPRFTPGYYLLSKTLVQSGDIKQAEKYFSLAINIDPFEADCYKELGGLYLKDKNYRQAAKIYEKALKAGVETGYFRKALSEIPALNK